MTIPVSSIKADSVITTDSSLFSGGDHKPLMAMLEITSRCNMSCPVCFAGVGNKGIDLPLQEVIKRLHTLLECAGPIPVQISGGEPTLHPALLEIVSYARGLGFNNIELVTNGIVISNNPKLLQSLAEKGLTAVYLQFDGLEKDTYFKIRGQDMTEIRSRSIEAARKAKLCCTLAVAVVRGVNDHELGEVVRFGIANIDTIRAINFQAASSFSGRFTVQSPYHELSLKKLISLIEIQLQLKEGGFLSGVLGHPKCNGVSLLYVIENRLEPLFSYIKRSTVIDFLGENKRETVHDLFLGKERFIKKYFFKLKTWKMLSQAAAIFGSPPSLNRAIKSDHILIFAKSFMGKDSFLKKRQQNCVYGIVDSDGVHSFCAYNNYHRFKTPGGKQG